MIERGRRGALYAFGAKSHDRQSDRGTGVATRGLLSGAGEVVP
jgi:hypothetical protein